MDTGKDHDAALAAADRALRLAPNSAMVLLDSGWLRAYAGDAPTAIAHLERAMRLSPVDPAMSYLCTALSLAHFVGGGYEQAATWARRAVRDRPTYLPAHRLLATSLAQLGDADAARGAVRALLARAAPGYTVAAAAAHTGLRDPVLRGRYLDGLRWAGLPEG